MKKEKDLDKRDALARALWSQFDPLTYVELRLGRLNTDFGAWADHAEQIVKKLRRKGYRIARKR